jgi:hypothetical protein
MLMRHSTNTPAVEGYDPKRDHNRQTYTGDALPTFRRRNTRSRMQSVSSLGDFQDNG